MDRLEKGFTLFELVVVMVLLGILSATATILYANLTSEARTSSLNGLQAAVVTSMNQFHVAAILTKNINIPNGTQMLNGEGASVRIWNGWPDRWWDGVGISLAGAQPTSGGYLSTSAFPYGDFTFYGYGNGSLPQGLAGWRIENAKDPFNCSLTYNNDGSGNPPILTVYSSGC